MIEILLSVLAVVCTGDCQQDAYANTPVHLTNYWPFNANGDLYQETNYQCQQPCDTTAAGYSVWDCLDQDFYCAACPLSLINERITLSGVDKPVWCVDTYGYRPYQRGIFWHEGHSEFVWGVDLLRELPTYRVVPAQDVLFKDP